MGTKVTHHPPDQGRLPGSGLPDQGKSFSRFNFKADIFQNTMTIWIAEADIPQFDRPMHRPAVTQLVLVQVIFTIDELKDAASVLVKQLHTAIKPGSRQ